MHRARWAPELTHAKREDEKGAALEHAAGEQQRRWQWRGHRHIELWGELVNTRTGECGLQGIPDNRGNLSSLGNKKKRKKMEEPAECPADGKQEWSLTTELLRTPVQLKVTQKLDVTSGCS